MREFMLRDERNRSRQRVQPGGQSPLRRELPAFRLPALPLCRAGGWIATKSVGRYADEPETGQRYLMKCAGVATMQANLLMIVDQQLLGAGTLSTTILQPSYRSDVGVLSGICADTPSGG